MKIKNLIFLWFFFWSSLVFFKANYALSSDYESCLKIWATPEDTASLNQVGTIHQHMKMFLKLKEKGIARIYFDQNSKSYILTLKLDPKKSSSENLEGIFSIATKHLPKEVNVELPTLRQAKISLDRLVSTESVAKGIPKVWFIGNLFTMLAGIDNPIIPNSISPEVGLISYLGIGFFGDYVTKKIPWETWKKNYDPNENPQLFSLEDLKNYYHFATVLSRVVSENKINLIVHPESFEIVKVFRQQLPQLEEIDLLTHTTDSLKILLMKQQIPYGVNFVFHIDESNEMDLPGVNLLVSQRQLKIEPIDQNIEAIMDLKLDVELLKSSTSNRLSLQEFRYKLQKRKDFMIYRVVTLKPSSQKTIAYITLVKGFHSFFGISVPKDADIRMSAGEWNSLITNVFKVKGHTIEVSFL